MCFLKRCGLCGPLNVKPMSRLVSIGPHCFRNRMWTCMDQCGPLQFKRRPLKYDVEDFPPLSLNLFSKTAVLGRIQPSSICPAF
jgi:hypothetical protein